MEWLAVAACVRPGFLSKPMEFLSYPNRRVRPSWAHTVVSAVNEEEALSALMRAWDLRLLIGQMQGDRFLEGFVVPLKESSLADLEPSLQKTDEQVPLDEHDWLTVAISIRPDFLSNAAEFIANGGADFRPSFAYGVVRAKNESEAYCHGADAWGRGLLVGQQPGEDMVNWYVAQLRSSDDKRDEPMAVTGLDSDVAASAK